MGKTILKDFIVSLVLTGVLYLILNFLFNDIKELPYILVFSFLVIFTFSLGLSMLVFKLKSKIEYLNRKIDELNKFDEITGIYKRGYFFDMVKRYIQIAKANSLNLSVMVVDIDKFREINRDYGIKKGDEIIKTVGEVLKQSSDGMDVIGRFGADEFVLMSFCTTKEMRQRAREIISQIKQKCEIDIGISVGIAEFSALDNEMSFVKKASEALLLAKYKGGDRVDFVEHFLLFE
ncbi:MAG: GGDEF domain-containing protein [Epsilonproteobacteria bacterium]|nr:GGDEF domain-containing protein [Campylobacterota bacterium]